MSSHEDDQLRGLLGDVVSDVEPRHGLDAIRSRTEVSPASARRPWLLGTAAVVATAATITAVAVISNGPGTTSTDPGFVDSPSASPSVAEEPPPDEPTMPTEPTDDPTACNDSGFAACAARTPSGSQAAVPVYYVGETGMGPRLYREFHGGNDVDRLAAALVDAVSGTPEDRDFSSPWPSGTTVNASFDGIGNGGEIGITLNSPAGSSLHDRPGGMPAALAEMAVQQLVYTAQAATQTTAPVQFYLEGGRTGQLLGVPVSEPLGRADASSTLAQVWIISPEEGALVQSGFLVEGVGAFFEANAAWELRQGNAVVRSGFTTAEECCRMAPYSFPVEAPPGDYTLAVMDQDMSGGEGFAPFEDTKQITITN